MKKHLLFTLGIAGLVALGETTAMAIPIYTDLDVFGLSGQKVDANTPLAGAFQISSNDADGIPDLTGYNPLSEQITGASVVFVLRDDSFFDGQEQVKIDLGSNFFQSGAVLDSPLIFSILGGSVSGSALLDLDADGVLNYTISSADGDFVAISAFLSATAGPKSTSVPDGGSTVALLGLGLLGLGWARRKLMA